jgi:hypothetical protein
VSGYSGIYCQTEINECASNPCRNGATCVDAVNQFSCVCVPGFSGTLCQTDINECASNPCQNGASCSDAVNQFSCLCAPGFSDVLCQTDINECASNPCQNGASCFDAVNQFSCVCFPGFSDTLCQTDINECASNPCLNGATCFDAINSFSCLCSVFFNGTLCQNDINECATNHGGCSSLSLCVNTFGGFYCRPYLQPRSLVFLEPEASTVTVDHSNSDNSTFLLDDCQGGERFNVTIVMQTEPLSTVLEVSSSFPFPSLSFIHRVHLCSGFRVSFVCCLPNSSLTVSLFRLL